MACSKRRTARPCAVDDFETARETCTTAGRPGPVDVFRVARLRVIVRRSVYQCRRAPRPDARAFRYSKTTTRSSIHVRVYESRNSIYFTRFQYIPKHEYTFIVTGPEVLKI